MPDNCRPPFIWLLTVLLLGLITPVAAQQRSGPTAEWEVLQNCELLPDKVVDGDSFHVLHKGREYIFRLYFVDAPETSDSVPERLVEQAAYFGIATNEVAQAGERAAEFTRQKLTSGRITVITRWQNAMGRSSLARFYAVVLVGGKNLAEELVGAGLARIYGYRANWPGGPNALTFVEQLRDLEHTARSRRLGVWDDTKSTRAGSTLNDRTPGSTEASSLIDLNTASTAELDRLPGIGKVLAGRIVSQRPFDTVEDLEKVPGIGPKTLDRLRPLVRVTAPNPPVSAD